MMTDRKRGLVFHGVVLFLLGLLVGLVEEKFANPRMGLAAHLEGLMNGTFLLALGAAWQDETMSERSGRTAYVCFLYGSYANLIVTTLAAILGTRAMTPLTGAIQSAEKWKEFLVTAGFVSVGLTMIVGSVIVVQAFRKR
jgi:hydroxylaminobenzene mutase